MRNAKPAGKMEIPLYLASNLPHMQTFGMVHGNFRVPCNETYGMVHGNFHIPFDKTYMYGKVHGNETYGKVHGNFYVPCDETYGMVHGNFHVLCNETYGKVHGNSSCTFSVVLRKSIQKVPCISVSVLPKETWKFHYTCVM